jgi:uncharacterized protein YuzE
MKVIWDKDLNIGYVYVVEGTMYIAKSVEMDCVVDYDADGNIVGVELIPL